MGSKSSNKSFCRPSPNQIWDERQATGILAVPHHKYVGPLRTSAVQRFKKSINLMNTDLQLQKHDQVPHVPKSSGSTPRGSFRITWNTPFHMKRKNIIQVPPLSPLSRSALVKSEREAPGTWTTSSSKLKRRGVENKRRVQTSRIATFNFKSMIKCHMFSKVEFLGEASEQTCTSPFYTKTAVSTFEIRSCQEKMMSSWDLGSKFKQLEQRWIRPILAQAANSTKNET